MSEDQHLERAVACRCGWIGKTGELIVKDKLRCPKCDSEFIAYPNKVEGNGTRQ